MKKRQMTDRLQCNQHPDAPHGFDRNASHNADRYVCECENWEPKPVAHVYLFDKAGRPLVAWDNAKDIKLGDKLYAAPKQWVGLTDFEKRQILLDDPIDWINAIETKLKEKNA